MKQLNLGNNCNRKDNVPALSQSIDQSGYKRKLREISIRLKL
ncbi:hypothetical protein [Thermophagus xiamenensis]|nr:hypothetical protein [Thermophagus xiamenensis]